MNVVAILKAKGRAVSTLSPEETLLDAVQMLSSKRIGAVVIVDDAAKIAGILSERDIVAIVAKNGPHALELPIADVMTSQVVTCSEADTIDELMSKMTTRRCRHLPVVKDGKLDGIISIGDVVKHHIAEVEMEAMAMRSYIATG